MRLPIRRHERVITAVFIITLLAAMCEAILAVGDWWAGRHPVQPPPALVEAAQARDPEFFSRATGMLTKVPPGATDEETVISVLGRPDRVVSSEGGRTLLYAFRQEGDVVWVCTVAINGGTPQVRFDDARSTRVLKLMKTAAQPASTRGPE